jgi:hypothetical protein
MNKFEIENSITEIIASCDFLDYKNPLTYLIFLDRYRHMLNENQIATTEEIINNLKSEMNAYTNMNLKKFEDPICQIPIHERPNLK